MPTRVISASYTTMYDQDLELVQSVCIVTIKQSGEWGTMFYWVDIDMGKTDPSIIPDAIARLYQDCQLINPMSLSRKTLEFLVNKSFNDFLQEMDYKEQSVKPMFPDEV